MLMRVKNEVIDKHSDCYINDDKPGKYDTYSTEWERTLWEAYAYRCPTKDCDTKRTGPCKTDIKA